MWCTLQDLRRSNFTAADCRDCNFKNTKLQGTYFIKTVVARANFEVGAAPTVPSHASAPLWVWRIVGLACM